MLIWLAAILTILNLPLILLRKTKSAALCTTLLIILIFISSTQFPVSFLISKTEAHSPVNTPEFAGNNLIVLTTGGIVADEKNNIQTHITAESRTLEAARVYLLCRKVIGRICKLLITGGDPQNYGNAESNIVLKELSDIGIETSDVLIESQSRNTEQNALLSSQIIVKLAPEKVFVVTSGYHTRRTQMWFRHFGVQADMIPSDHLSAGGPWWLPRPYNFIYAEICVREIIGIAWLLIKTFSY